MLAALAYMYMQIIFCKKTFFLIVPPFFTLHIGQLIGVAFGDATVGLIKGIPDLVKAGVSTMTAVQTGGMNVIGAAMKVFGKAGGAAEGEPEGLNKGTWFFKFSQ